MSATSPSLTNEILSPLNSEGTRMTKALVGKKIQTVRYMTSEEAKESGWCKQPLLIQLDDGLTIIPLQDDEGNDGGSLEFFHHDKKIKESGAPVMWVD